MAPMMGPPMMAHPMAHPGMMPIGYRPPPPSYMRAQIAWGEAYDRRMPFMIPAGLPPDVARTTDHGSTLFSLPQAA